MDRDNPTVEIVGANEYFNNLKTLAIRECLKNPNDEKAIELVRALINSSGKAESFRFKCDNHSWWFSDGNDFFLPAEEYVQEEMEL